MSVMRAQPSLTPMRRGRLLPCSCRHARVDGPDRPSGRNASPSGITPSTIMSPARSQPGSRTEIRLGARAHTTRTTNRAHAPPILSSSTPSIRTRRLPSGPCTDKEQSRPSSSRSLAGATVSRQGSGPGMCCAVPRVVRCQTGAEASGARASRALRGCGRAGVAGSGVVRPGLGGADVLPFLRRGQAHPATPSALFNDETPLFAGLRAMRRRGLEPPPGYPGPGPQPGASTNSAIGAGRSEYSPAGSRRARHAGDARHLCPSDARATFPNTCSIRREERRAAWTSART